MSQSSDLTDRDRELCRLECERQGADRPSQLTGLITALAVAKRFAYACPPDGVMGSVGGQLEKAVALMLHLEQLLAGVIEIAWYRSGPAVFPNGGSAAPANEILSRLEAWAREFIHERSGTSLSRYEAYEFCHPHADGNARVGLCLWAIDTYWETGQWPADIPLEVFGPEGTPLRDAAYYQDMWS